MAQAETRIVILGKTGSGKSSLGNTILTENAFTVNHSVNAGTKKCKSKTHNVLGRETKLIDTPGLFDTDPESSELSPELLKCMQECTGGVHAFLLVLKVEKYTKQEQAVVDVILKYFSEKALKYTTVVFTHGDQLEEGKKIEDWARENKALASLIQKCGGRCHVFDNKYWRNSQDPNRNNQHQVKDLLNTIDQTVEKNGGECYTNEMLQRITGGFRVKLTGVSTGILLGALLGVPAMVAFTVNLTNGILPAKLPVVIGVVVAAGGVAGGAYGGYKGHTVAKQAETPKEAAAAVWQETKCIISQIKSIVELNIRNKSGSTNPAHSGKH